MEVLILPPIRLCVAIAGQHLSAQFFPCYRLGTRKTRKADIAVGLSISLIRDLMTQAIALMRAVRRLLWRAALFLWINPRAA